METDLNCDVEHTSIFKNLPGNVIDNLLEGFQVIGHDERYLYLNKAAARHGRKARDDLIGKKITVAYPGIENTHMYMVLKRCLNMRESQIMENEFTFPDGKKGWFELRFEPVPEGVFILSMDISDRKRSDMTKLMMVDLLHLITTIENKDTLISAVLNLLKEWSGCDAVGIHLTEPNHGTSFMALGFPELCVQFNNKGPCNDVDLPQHCRVCVCEKLFAGHDDGIDSCFINDGYFFSNNTDDLFDKINPQKHMNHGFRCQELGYRSMAFIPLQTGERRLGLLQFNSRHEGYFTSKYMEIYKWVADNIAIYFAKKDAEKRVFEFNSRLGTLTHVIQDLSYIRMPDRIVDIVQREAQSLFQADRVVVFVKAGGVGGFGSQGVQGIEDVVCSMAVAHEKTLVKTDFSEDISLKGKINNPDHYRSAVVVPFNKESLLGAVGVFWTRSYTPTGEDVNMLEALSNSTSVALERIRIYQDLEVSHKQYRDLVENLNDVVFYLNSKGQFVYISPAVEKFGFSPHDLIGKKFSQFVHLEDVDYMEQRFSGAITGHSIPSEFRAYDKNGIIRYLRVSSRVVVQDGQPIGVTGILVDLTEKRNAEEQLRSAQRMEAIGTLAGGIAHDFNNILSSIIGFSELSIEETDPKSEVGSYLKEIFTAGNRAKDLVRQILTFARQSDVEFIPIQVSSIAKEVLKFIRSSTPATVQIKSHINSRSIIQGNATQIHQIFMNLLTNALQAMEDQEEGELHVEVKDVFIDETGLGESLDLKPGPYLFIRVADTGTGIDPDIRSNIFEPYFTTKETGKGTGMGLSIVHGIVESYKGKMVVESTPEKGTSFSIYFPATQDRLIQPKEQPVTLPGGCERILCVDDELSIARMISHTLERLGYHVVIKTDSDEALAEFKTNPFGFDLVLTDMTMPHMTGDRLARELLEIRQDIPVIVCTGYSKKISEQKAKDIGIKALIHKPLLKADIANVVRQVLNDNKGVEHATMHSGD